MSEIGLVEAIAKVRAELADAVAQAANESVQFPVGAVTIEFQVGVTKDGGANGGVRLWVLQLGGTTKYAKETVQTIRVELGAPVGPDGERILVNSQLAAKPG
ncbi:trypco2 family protein [Dactylosporangium sp. CA-233914]|uniref:trypco2 family protein n=1 Tax=Dactylosporangium sp. CA-233914 TaxID=3239934 RepID=UPI003D936F39